ncbi:MAG: penicillin-binding transpeptidase domain-containing protein [Bacteroidia bacterium]
MRLYLADPTRQNFYLVLLLIIFGLLSARLLLLQIHTESQPYAIRKVEVLPPRGSIYDRKGRLWVATTPSFNVYITPKYFSLRDTKLVYRLLDLAPTAFERRWQNAVAYSRSKPSLLEKGLTPEKFLVIAENSRLLLGISSEVIHARRYLYPHGGVFLGYLAEVTPQDIERSEGYYRLGNLIGAIGIEKQYEKILAGRKGYRFVVVDAMGREKAPYQDRALDIPPVAGQDIHLTPDLELQAFAESLFYGKVGSLVAIEPKSGEVLALVSSPGYDPNLLATSSFAQGWQKLSQHPLLPLYNRPIQAVYPPGSIFKLLNALIALQESTLFTHTVYPCAGGFLRNRGKPACHVHPAPLDLVGAVQHSCNAYFASVYVDFLHHPKFGSVEEAYTLWREYMLRFGIGRRIGIDLPQEKRGVIPRAQYYHRLYRHRWNAFTILSNAIGQGEILMTPLQMANVMCLIANRGYYIQPHLFKQLRKYPERKIVHFDTIRTSIDKRHFETVIQGMELAVSAGTGYMARIPTIRMAGKTGTAQNPHGKDHSVFVGFAPVEDPKIAIAVVVENAGWGGVWAAPLASLVVEKYLQGTTNPWRMEHIRRGLFVPDSISTFVTQGK